MIVASPADLIYIMACFSNNVFDYLDSNQASRVIGLNGMVDAVIAGNIPLFFEASSLKTIHDSLNNVVERVFSIANNEKEAHFLANSESGKRFAVKRQTIIQRIWGIPWYIENILWFNLDKPTGDTFTLGGSAGISAMIALLVKFTALTGPEGALIGTILILYLTTCRLTSINRYRGDYMFGIGAVLIPIPILNFWYDYGNDDYGFDGEFSIPYPNLPAAPLIIELHYVIGAFSTSWLTILA